MCGEHYTIRPLLSLLLGSSPHVRGALESHDVRHQLHGIIPACAGSTDAVAVKAHPMRDHPRMCGEHYEQAVGGVDTLGSSPHVRGAPERRRWQSGRRGIIPACAGSTRNALYFHVTVRDHPRMCGEH